MLIFRMLTGRALVNAALTLAALSFDVSLAAGPGTAPASPQEISNPSFSFAPAPDACCMESGALQDTIGVNFNTNARAFGNAVNATIAGSCTSQISVSFSAVPQSANRCFAASSVPTCNGSVTCSGSLQSSVSVGVSVQYMNVGGGATASGSYDSSISLTSSLPQMTGTPAIAGTNCALAVSNALAACKTAYAGAMATKKVEATTAATRMLNNLRATCAPATKVSADCVLKTTSGSAGGGGTLSSSGGGNFTTMPIPTKPPYRPTNGGRNW